MRVVGCVLHARGNFCTPLQTHSIIHDPACIRGQFSLASLSACLPATRPAGRDRHDAGQLLPASFLLQHEAAMRGAKNNNTPTNFREHTQDMIPWE